LKNTAKSLAHTVNTLFNFTYIVKLTTHSYFINKQEGIPIKVSAILDNNIVSGFVQVDNASTNRTQLIELKLYYAPETEDLCSANSVLLDSKRIPATFLKNNHISYQFHNLKNLENLSIEVVETRQNDSGTTTVDVIDGLTTENNTARETTVNPIRDREREEKHQENHPHPDENESHYVYLNEDISNIVYKMTPETPLEKLESGSRYVLDQKLNLVYLDEREEQYPPISEESLINLLPNPGFLGDGQPDDYEIINTGFVIGDSNPAYTTEPLNVWRIRGSNTSMLNAFNTVVFETKLIEVENTVLNNLTSSVYYKLNHERREVDNPSITSLTLCLRYYNENMEEIGISKEEIPVNEVRNFFRIEANFTNTTIPQYFKYFKWQIETNAIDSTNAFILELLAPQVEKTHRSTTFTMGRRGVDAYRTPPVEYKAPYFLQLCSTHSDTYLRALMDTTVNGENGFRWMLSGSKMQFRYLGQNNQTLVNVFSNVIQKTLNEKTTYGLYVEDGKITFYVDNELLSEHSISGIDLNLGQRRAYVGRLYINGAALNDRIYELNICKDKP
jgi:hypothetical protein